MRIRDLHAVCRLRGQTGCACKGPEDCELSIREIANFKTHTIKTPAECDCIGGPREGHCNICDGGLAYCTVCKGGEQELNDASCGERLRAAKWAASERRKEIDKSRY